MNMEAAEHCIFCAIVAGQSPVSKVYEDDRVLGLMTIGPVTPGHAMVIPREHVPYFSQLDPGLGTHIFRVAQRIAAAIRTSGLRCEGINLFLADGEAAAQEVFHFHLHVFPRFRHVLLFRDRRPFTRGSRDDAAAGRSCSMTGPRPLPIDRVHHSRSGCAMDTGHGR